MDHRITTYAEKPAENISGNADGELTHQGKVNFHGPPSSFSPGADARHLNDQLKSKDEVIKHLTSEIQLYMGKIKGYQTLGYLFQESKQECAQYKQKNEELANKLDVVMKRLQPEKDPGPSSLTVVTTSRSDRLDSTTTFTTTAELNYRTAHEDFENLFDERHKAAGDEELQRLSAMHLNPDNSTKDQDSAHLLVVETEERNTITAESNAKVERNMNAGEDRGNKSRSGSSASSPSFVCIGGSGLSSIDQSPALDSLQEEKVVGSDVRPTVLDQNMTEMKSLNEFLSDSNTSADMRAMALDLRTAGNRAAKIEKQARVQQVLLDELQREKSVLLNELHATQEQLEIIQEKYSTAMEKLNLMEMERQAAADLSVNAGSGITSSEWVKVDNQTEEASNQTQAERIPSITSREIELKSQILSLQKQVVDLEMLTRNMMDVYERCNRAREHLIVEKKNLEKKLLDQQASDLKRQEEFDRMLLSSKKHREELETEKEEIQVLLMQERQQRRKFEEQCLTLQDKISHLESQVHQLEKQPSPNPVKEVRARPLDSSLKASSSGSHAFDKQALMTELALLQQQVAIYKEDFDHERKDRELAQAHSEALKLQFSATKKDFSSSQNQLATLTTKLHDAKKENEQLKRKFMQALDELKVLKGQIKPVSQSPQHLYSSHVPDNKWTCTQCTFLNRGSRQMCEMCGAYVHQMRRFVLESDMDLNARSGLPGTPVMEECCAIPLEEKFPRSLDRRPPKL